MARRRSATSAGAKTATPARRRSQPSTPQGLGTTAAHGSDQQCERGTDVRKPGLLVQSLARVQGHDADGLVARVPLHGVQPGQHIPRRARGWEAPDGFRRAPAPMLPMPIAMTRPTRAAAARTNDAIISTNAELRNTTKLGRRFCEVTNLYI